MCIIAVIPEGKQFSEQELSTCWKNNDDGGGFAYVKDGKVQIRKGFMDKESFSKALNSLHGKYGATSPFIIHFRIRTHGAMDKERTHPFRLEDGSALAHNGILSGPGMTDSVKSDTQLFIERFGSLLSKEIVRREKQVIGKAIGFNKFAILHPDATFTIVNDHHGTWDSGRWFSNSSYKPFTYGKYGSYNYGA